MVLASRATGLVVVVGLVIVLFIIARKLLRYKIKSKLYQPVKRQKRLVNVDYYDLFIGVKSGNILTNDSTESGRYLRQKRKEEDNLNVWYINNFQDNRVLLYFHGNSYNVSYRKYMIDICKILKFNLLLVDYRGYGRSSGQAKPANVLEDADASYNFLINQGYSDDQIVVWGESLGGTPACYIAGKYKVNSLILLSTFASLHSLLRDNSNAVREGAFFVLRAITADINDKTNNIEFIKSVDPSCPVVIFHSREDTMIPYSNAIELASALPADHQKLLIEINGDHDAPKISQENFRNLLKVLNLPKITDKEVDKIINIIDNLSFISQTTSRSIKTTN